MMKVAGVVVALFTANALALNTGHVEFLLKSPQAGQTVSMDGTVNWTAAIGSVTGNNMGINTYQFVVELRDSTHALIPVTLPQAMWARPYIDNQTAQEATGIGTAGLGLHDISIFQDLSLLAIAESYGSWYSSYKPGIGLLSSKATLLADPTSDYDVVTNSFSVAALGLVPGTYSVRLVPDYASVLNLYKGTTTNLVRYDVDRSAALVEATLGASQQFSFVVVPEPTTLMLLAGAAAFLRRRRA